MFDLIKNALSSVLGGKTPEGNSQVLEMVQKLLTGKAEKQRQFELKLEELYQQNIQKELEDRQDAREMQRAALSQNDRFSKRFIYYLSGIIIAIIFLGLGGLFYFHIPEGNEQLVSRIVDIFQNFGMSVLGFYFGTKLKKTNA